MDSSYKFEFSGSESSLNLSQKIPVSNKKCQPRFLNKGSISQDDPIKTIFDKNSSMKSPTNRKKNYMRSSKRSNFLLGRLKKDGHSNVIKTLSNKRLIITPNVKNSAHRMVENFRRRKQYKTLNNLSEFHYSIIGDAAFNNEDEKRVKKVSWRQSTLMIMIIKLMNLENALKRGKLLKLKLQNLFTTYVPTFYPNNPLIVFWDLIVMTLTFSRIYFYSIEKGFVTDLSMERLEDLLFVVLLIDIGMKLNTKIFKEGVLITDRSLILRHFLKKNILSDVIPCLGLCISNFSNNSIILSEIKLLICVKLLKISKVGKRIREVAIDTDRSESAYNCFILLIKIFIMAHSIACLWHYIGYICEVKYPNQDNWLRLETIPNEIWEIKYLYSIYWAITTMLTVGYGDITPTNNIERLFNTLAMLIGCGMFGYSMNSIGEIIKYSERKNGILKEKMNKVALMMKGKNLPLETQTKVKKYLQFVWNQDQKEDPEHENYIMGKLSSKLRDEIFYHTHVKYLKSVPAFKTFSDQTLIELASHMKRVRFSPEEFVYREGEHEDFCLYFVLEGRLSMAKERSMKAPIVLRGYKKDDYFGVEEVFTGKARSHGIVSIDFSSLFQISRKDIINVLQKIPFEYEKFCQIKDLELLYNEHFQYEITCCSCGFTDHSIEKCRYLKYDPMKLMIIGKYNNKRRKFAKRFKRMRIKNSALLEKNNNLLSHDDFLQIYDDDEDFNELRNFYLEQYKKELTLCYSIESPSPEGHDESKNESLPSVKENFTHKTRSMKSMKSMRNPPGFMKSTRRVTNVSFVESPKEHPSIKFDRNKGTRASLISRSIASTQADKKERSSQRFETLIMDKMKSYIFYFPKNNIEKIIARKNTKILANENF